MAADSMCFGSRQLAESLGSYAAAACDDPSLQQAHGHKRWARFISPRAESGGAATSDVRRFRFYSSAVNAAFIGNRSGLGVGVL
jgi:hypothetical protein